MAELKEETTGSGAKASANGEQAMVANEEEGEWDGDVTDGGDLDPVNDQSYGGGGGDPDDAGFNKLTPSKSSSKSGSKSHHKSGSERRRKHHHKHHHSSSSRSEKRRRRHGGDDEEQPDHHHDDGAAPPGPDGDDNVMAASRRRRRSDSSGKQQQGPSSPRKHSSSSHDVSAYDRRGSDGVSPYQARASRDSLDEGGEKGVAFKSSVGKKPADDDEAEDGEILEDGELGDDDDNDDGERNETKEKSTNKSEKYEKSSPSDRKSDKSDYRDKKRKEGSEKKSKKRKLYSQRSEEDEDVNPKGEGSGSVSPPAPAWGSGVSQVSTKPSPSTGRGQGKGSSRYSRSASHGGQSPPGLYDSPSEDSDHDMIPDGYMGGDNEYDKRGRKRGQDMDGRKRGRDGGPPRKKTLLEMSMSERPVCKFYMDGKCAKGSGCSFNHDIETPRPKMEVCKYHLTVKGCHKEHCLYMHENYPCKYYHTGAKCFSGDRCKFSHAPLTEETRRALALRVAAEDLFDIEEEMIVDMEDPDYSSYRNYRGGRDYDNSDDRRDRDDYDDGEDYCDEDYAMDPRARLSLLGSPPRMRGDPKKIPSLFEIKVTPPGQSPKAGSMPLQQQPNMPPVNSMAVGPPGNMGGGPPGNMGGGPPGNMGGGPPGNMNPQQQLGMRPNLGLLGPGGPQMAAALARGTTAAAAAMMMGMQQQQQLRPGFGLPAPAQFLNQAGNINNMQRLPGNAGSANNGSLPPVFNMLGSLIRDMQNGPAQNNMGNMGPGQNSTALGQNNMGQNSIGPMGNIGQNKLGNMGANNINQNMGNMPLNNMAQNNIRNMGPNNIGNMNNIMPPNSMGNMNNVSSNSMGNMSNIPPNNMGNMNNMPPNSMGNMNNMPPNMNTMPPNMNSIAPNMRPNNMPGLLGDGPGIPNIPPPGFGNNMGMTAFNSNNSSNNRVAGGPNLGNTANNMASTNTSSAIGIQGVGLMDVDYRIGQPTTQQSDSLTPAERSTSEENKQDVEVKKENLKEEVVKEEMNEEGVDDDECSQDLGELDRMRREIQEQIRAEEAAAASSEGEDDGKLEIKEEKEDDGDVKSAVKEEVIKEEQPASMAEIPSHLPRKQRELLKRIQQQEMSRQREKERQEAADRAEEAEREAQAKAEVDDFYSSEEEEDGPKQPKLTDILKSLSQQTATSTPVPSTTSTTAAEAAVSSTDTPATSTPAGSSTTTHAQASTFNIMQMIQNIRTKTGVSAGEQSSDSQREKKPEMSSPASPPASPTEQAPMFKLPPLTVDPPVVSATPTRPLTYSVVKLSLSQARPYVQLPSGVVTSDHRYRGDPRVKWHIKYLERQAEKKAGELSGDGDPRRRPSVDDGNTIASPTQASVAPKVQQAASDPRLKKADPRLQQTTDPRVDPRLQQTTDPRVDPRLQQAGSSPTSSGARVDPRLAKAASRAIDPRLAGRALDPRLNRQNSLPGPQQGGFNNIQMGAGNMGNMMQGGINNQGMGGMMGPGMNNDMGGMMNSQNMHGGMLNTPQMNNMGIQNQMGGFRTNQMGVGGGLMGSGVLPNNMMLSGGIPVNRMAGPGAMNIGGQGNINISGAPGSLGNQARNQMRPRMQGGILVGGGIGPIGGADMPMMRGQGPQGFPQTNKMDPRSCADPRLKARDPRDPRASPGNSDPITQRDPRPGGANPKDPRNRDPRAAKQLQDHTDPAGSPNDTNSNNSRLGWGADSASVSSPPPLPPALSNSLPAFPASLAQPPSSSLPSSLSLTPSLSVPSSLPQPNNLSTNTDKPSLANFDHRNDPRFKRIKRSARAGTMDYSSPLGGDTAAPEGNSEYNSYNRPKAATPVPRLERHTDTPSPSLPDTLEDFDMGEPMDAPDIQVKDIFKSIDPTASPFC